MTNMSVAPPDYLKTVCNVFIYKSSLGGQMTWGEGDE